MNYSSMRACEDAYRIGSREHNRRFWHLIFLCLPCCTASLHCQHILSRTGFCLQQSRALISLYMVEGGGVAAGSPLSLVARQEESRLVVPQGLCCAARGVASCRRSYYTAALRAGTGLRQYQGYRVGVLSPNGVGIFRVPLFSTVNASSTSCCCS